MQITDFPTCYSTKFIAQQLHDFWLVEFCSVVNGEEAVLVAAVTATWLLLIVLQPPLNNFILPILYCLKG